MKFSRTRVTQVIGLCLVFSLSLSHAFLISTSSLNPQGQLAKRFHSGTKQPYYTNKNQALYAQSKEIGLLSRKNKIGGIIEGNKESLLLSSPKLSISSLPLSFSFSLLISLFAFFSPLAVSADDNSSTGETGQSFKIKKGAASTLNQGAVKTITRGVTLDNSDFSNSDLSGVSFQQSLIRNGKFIGTKLKAASFFDADLTGADFTGADMTQCNLELANLKDAVLRDAVITEAYISGATRLTNIDITGADFTDTLLRSDQQKALCKKASGVNSITGVATADSLLCN